MLIIRVKWQESEYLQTNKKIVTRLTPELHLAVEDPTVIHVTLTRVETKQNAVETKAIDTQQLLAIFSLVSRS